MFGTGVLSGTAGYGDSNMLFGGRSFAGTGAIQSGLPDPVRFGGAHANMPGYGAAPVDPCSGLSGFLTADKPQTKAGHSSTMTPVTIQILRHAIENTPSDQLIVNGRELSMFALVACLEKVQTMSGGANLTINDSSGCCNVVTYDNETRDFMRSCKVGTYVRICGVVQGWTGQKEIRALDVRAIENPNEIAFHFVEVVHNYLSFTGKMEKNGVAVASNTSSLLATNCVNTAPRR